MLGVLVECVAGGGLGDDGVPRPHLYHLSGRALREAIRVWQDSDAWALWHRRYADHLGQGIRYYGDAEEALRAHLSAHAGNLNGTQRRSSP